VLFIVSYVWIGVQISVQSALYVILYIFSTAFIDTTKYSICLHVWCTLWFNKHSDEVCI